MNTSLYRSLLPRPFDLQAGNLAQLAGIDYFHHVRAFQKETVTVLSILGAVISLQWALGASSFFHTYCLHRSKIHRYNHVSSEGSVAWALVTGAAGGIGYDIVRELAEKGFNVVLHGRVEQDLLAAMARVHDEFPDRNFRMLLADPTALGTRGFFYRQSYGNWRMERKLDLEVIKNELSKLNLTVLINCANAEAGHAVDLAGILDENEKSIWKHVNSDALSNTALSRSSSNAHW
ncbi:short chain dehydrogenase [Fusarium tjaetaba]|uniref:Short chain dehydrogenase n=1 Tax=Fusarium tjaetaba TaxID=1567544 RepID=A0A8H5S8D3_9HYPO|nr:short chain dehydrogenase [Fusarium tjaetaba]KAF5648431.1 short chain dehydrogenase [Fusarium tjaetaba]